MVSRYARAPKGERAHGKAPRNWGNNDVTLISWITLAGMGPSMSIEGPSDRESFGLYLNEVLRAKLSPKRIVVMDNLSVHKNRRVRELVEERWCCELWFLPAYSPELNPIEQAFSKIKGALRKAKARGLETLFEATREALRSVTEEDACGFFSHCGYFEPQVHSL